jgi:hypothetical protein
MRLWRGTGFESLFQKQKAPSIRMMLFELVFITNSRAQALTAAGSQSLPPLQILSLL